MSVVPIGWNGRETANICSSGEAQPASLESGGDPQVIARRAHAPRQEATIVRARSRCPASLASYTPLAAATIDPRGNDLPHFPARSVFVYKSAKCHLACLPPGQFATGLHGRCHTDSKKVTAGSTAQQTLSCKL